jgi:hypothetical protein
MIQITNVEISKNPVSTGETFIISVTANEVIATWADVKNTLWSTLKSLTWDRVKRKFF